jgi:hypothetical protein
MSFIWTKVCVLVYLKTLSVTKTTQSQMKGWQVNNEIMVWKEVVVIIQEFTCWD